MSAGVGLIFDKFMLFNDVVLTTIKVEILRRKKTLMLWVPSRFTAASMEFFFPRLEFNLPTLPLYTYIHDLNSQIKRKQQGKQINIRSQNANLPPSPTILSFNHENSIQIK